VFTLFDGANGLLLWQIQSLTRRMEDFDDCPRWQPWTCVANAITRAGAIVVIPEAASHLPGSGLAVARESLKAARNIACGVLNVCKDVVNDFP
jgi:hypothetical protein